MYHIYIYIYVRTNIYIYIYIYTCICIYTHTHYTSAEAGTVNMEGPRLQLASSASSIGATVCSCGRSDDSGRSDNV